MNTSRQGEPVHLDRAFEDGTMFKNEFTSGTLRPRTITQLVVTSGYLAASDGIVLSGTQGFNRQVPPGRYSVDLSIAELANGDQRVAYARVQFRDATPARWEMAVPVGRKLSELKDDEIFGYPVDSGTGSFLDRDTLRALEAMSDTESEDFTETMIDTMQRHYVTTWDWADMTVVPGTGANLVVFSSGFGDGYYPSHWGLDEYDEPVCIVTDFGIVS